MRVKIIKLASHENAATVGNFPYPFVITRFFLTFFFFFFCMWPTWRIRIIVAIFSGCEELGGGGGAWHSPYLTLLNV